MTATTPRTLRIAHVTDTHLGYRALYRADPETGRNQRALDVEFAYEAAIDDILTRDVDLVLHAGDVFHHTRPSWQALRCFLRQTRRLETAKIPTVVIAGNHDTPRLRISGSAFSVLDLALPDVRFVAGYDVEDVAFNDLDLTVVAVPHGALTNPDKPVAFPQRGRRNILLTHGVVPGLILRGPREPGEEELSGAMLDAGFDYVALGHYHPWGPQGNNAWYGGSTERIGWGDEKIAPGYLIVELGASGDTPKVEHIDLPTRPMRTLTSIDGSDSDARELADLVLDRVISLGEPEAMVRIQLLDTPRPIRREAEAILRRESTLHVWSLQVFSPADILSGFGERPTDTGMTDLRALFAEFVIMRTGKEYDEAFAARFKARGDRALEDAMRAAEASVAVEEPVA